MFLLYESIPRLYAPFEPLHESSHAHCKEQKDDVQRVLASSNVKSVLVGRPMEPLVIFAVASHTPIRSSVRGGSTIGSHATLRVCAWDMPREVIASIHANKK